MLMKYRTYLLSMLIVIAAQAAVPVSAAEPNWEPVKTERTDVKTVIRESDIEIKSARGLIIVSTNHSQQIKIFTILGRLVNSETLPAGRSQLQLPAHGVYIIKIGDLTCKVAV